VVAPEIRKSVLLLYLLFTLALVWAVMAHLQAGDSLQAILSFDHRMTVMVLLLVLVNITLRFSRWQFLLRKSEIRIPTRTSLSLYIATLGLIITPFYIGELFKPYMVKNLYGVQMRRTLMVVILERYLDLLALATLALVDLGGLADLGTWALLVAAPGICAVVLVLLPRLRLTALSLFSRFRLLLFFRSSLKPSAEVFRALGTPSVFLTAYLASLLAWCAAGACLYLTAWGCGVQNLTLAQATAGFATATSAGAATFFPGGIGAMEATLSARLEALAPPETAWSVVLMVRLLTLWFGVLLGGTVLFTLYRRFLGLRIDSDEEHFTEIAPVYDAQIPLHMRQHFLRKKVEPMQAVLEAAGIRSGKGLDIGCGTGWYGKALGEYGHTVFGLDQSPGQVKQFLARTRSSTALVGDAALLPYQDNCFDFTYAINIIHHLPGRLHQARALQEIRRVLKPGGLFFLHEINVLNPLNRFYMVFLFPVLKNIDEGTEHWILPGEKALIEGFQKEEIRYFTFLPDFLPAAALHLLSPVESMLEKSPARCMSAHYMMVLKNACPDPK